MRVVWHASRVIAPGLLALLVVGCSGGGSSAPTSAPVSGLASEAGRATSPAPTAEPSASVAPQVSPRPSTGWGIAPDEQATDAQLGAYTGLSSVLPGQAFDVFAGADAPTEGTVAAYRLGPYGGAGGALVAGPIPVSVPAAGAPVTDPDTRAVSAPWNATRRLDTTGWPPGFYFIQVTAAGKKTNVPFVVRSPEVTDAVVFIAGDVTWQAYNTWGGRSLYTGPGGFADRSYAVSFDRPYTSEWQIWYDYDVSAVNVLEAAGVPVAYTTVAAVAADPAALEGAAGAMSNGHDEYWPLSYRNALVTARDGGTNLAFLGANAGYWRVRMADSSRGPGRVVLGYKSATLDPLQDDPQTTARYRDEPYPLPENAVIGQLYDCFPSQGDMTIIEPGFFLFDGTGVTQDTAIPGLIGNESDRAFARPETPRPIQIPALSRAVCKGTTTYSTMTYYTTGSGAGVWASGTMNWGRAMSGPNAQFGLTEATTAFTRMVTANLARAMASGPMARSHPARDDYALIESLPDVNNAGSGTD